MKLKNAMLTTEHITPRILQNFYFWKLHENTAINERQRTVSNMLFEGFDGKLQPSKWAKITQVSTDTALLDIKYLIEKGILQETKDGGRNTNYELADHILA